MMGAPCASGTTLKALSKSQPKIEGGIMWWGIGIGGAVLYFILAFALGLMTLRNGHGLMFFLGIFFPFLWLFGAFMRPTEPAAA
jgi:hypothetical protein